MPFGYYDRLSPARQRIYRRSDSIGALALPEGVQAGTTVARIRDALLREEPRTVREASQQLVDTLVQGYQVPPIRVRVLARRPAQREGELYGLYEPEDGTTPARITVWMRTAQRKQVVAFRTYIRTLIHEICHHLDYEMFKLEETFHTDGFYRRESSLAGALFAQLQALDATPADSTRPMEIRAEAASGE
jgi:hypothetical protein